MWFQLVKTRLTSLINTAPGGFTLHPALGAISLCHISQGASTLRKTTGVCLDTTFVFSFDLLMLAVIFHWRI